MREPLMLLDGTEIVASSDHKRNRIYHNEQSQITGGIGHERF
jgi:hypothetical protein